MTVFRSGEGRSRAIDVPIKESEYIGEGQIGSAHRITIPSRKEGSEPLHFVYKKFDYPNPKWIEEEYVVHRKLLSLEHGQSYTVQTLRITDKGLFMTDLSEGGKNLVVSSNDNQRNILQEARRINKNNPDFISNFLAENQILNEEDWNAEFEKRAHIIAKETAEAGIRLHGESVFFVVYPNGEYRLFIVDLDNVKILKDYSTDDLYKYNLGEIEDLKPFIQELWFSLHRRK